MRKVGGTSGLQEDGKYEFFSFRSNSLVQLQGLELDS